MSWSYDSMPAADAPPMLVGGAWPGEARYDDSVWGWGFLGFLLLIGAAVVGSIALTFAVATRNASRRYVARVVNSTGTTVSAQLALINNVKLVGTWTASAAGVFVFTATAGPDLTTAVVNATALGANLSASVTSVTSTVLTITTATASTGTAAASTLNVTLVFPQ